MKTLILLFITQSTFNSAGSFSLKNISPFNRDRIIADTALDSSEPSYLEDLDLWARGKNVEGLNIKVSKLVHNTDKEALFTIKAEYSNPDIEDKVFHIIKEPGEITRKYNFIGYGFNGIGGEKFDNFI
ncbi:MAG: hypothetical protein HRU09_09215, partial [Oligoflexales bacterium]|nr:hypothetical protein [Oligoflexales bacterium]